MKKLRKAPSKKAPPKKARKCSGCSSKSCSCNKMKKKKRIPTPKAGRQKGNVKTQNMRKRSAY